jgi:hypothetical protein
MPAFRVQNVCQQLSEFLPVMDKPVKEGTVFRVPQQCGQLGYCQKKDNIFLCFLTTVEKSVLSALF